MMSPFSLVKIDILLAETSRGVAVSIPAGGSKISRQIVWPADSPDVPLAAIVPVVHELCDLVTAELLTHLARCGEKIHCVAGCNSCCGYVVAATGAEIDFIVSVLDSLPLELQDRAKNFWRELYVELESAGLLPLLDVAASRDEGWAALGDFLQERGLQCPLLGPAGRCEIYSARPVTCREFYSLGPATLCAALDTPRLERPVSFNDVLVNLEARLGTREARMWELPTLARHFSRGESPAVLDGCGPLVPPEQVAKTFAELVNLVKS